MRLADYLRGKIPYLAIVAFTTATTALLITLIFAVDWPFALLTTGILAGGSLLALLPEFLVKRRYYRQLLSRLESLDKKYLLAEVLAYPEFEEGRILYATLQKMAKSMNDEIARYSLSARDYREYIEMWVHEIKTPLAGLKLMSENIHDRDLLSELDRIDVLIEQVLYYARSTAV